MLSNESAQSTLTVYGIIPIKSITVSNAISLWGYKGNDPSPFLKITVTELKAYPKVRSAFEKGDVHFRSLFDGSTVLTFESNIAYPLRFMIDHHVRILLLLSLLPQEKKEEDGKLIGSVFWGLRLSE